LGEGDLAARERLHRPILDRRRGQDLPRRPPAVMLDELVRPFPVGLRPRRRRREVALVRGSTLAVPMGRLRTSRAFARRLALAVLVQDPSYAGGRLPQPRGDRDEAETLGAQPLGLDMPRLFDRLRSGLPSPRAPSPRLR